MRVLVVTPLYPPGSLVGAWLSTHEFAAHLARRGHEVTACQTLSGTLRPYTLDGVEVISGRRAFRPLARHADVVISHAGDDGTGARAALDANVASVRMVHGRNAPAETLDGAALVVFSSDNVAASTTWDGPSIVAAPPVDPERYRVEPTGDAVGIVNLSEAKGGPVYWNVVRLIGDERPFVAVRGGYGRQDARVYPNVEVLDPMPDPREAYRRMRVLLHPSADETWGRVPVEVGLSGIPVIAAPTPGTIETLGDSVTYVERDDRQGWVRAVRDLDDPERWACASQRIRERVEGLDLLGSLDVFADAIEAIR